jgi:rhodanese-related sulfurtransferase
MILVLCILLTVLAGSAVAGVNITPALPYVDINHRGEVIRIQRNQDSSNKLSNSFSKTSRKCPPFCVHAMKAAPGVTTVGELELLEFMMTVVKEGRGLIVDARTPVWYRKGTIPGSVNIPFTIATAQPEDSKLITVLKALGASLSADGVWDFQNARQLMLFCNGAWCDQSPRAIKGFMRLGYPPEKLFYYRGGMQMWQQLGFNVVLPAS